ncbi:MAG: putative glycosyltransferase [Fibrobacteres bacterium]|nr:putative glycosyltransferase [Fibrobacterota bacterium]
MSSFLRNLPGHRIKPAVRAPVAGTEAAAGQGLTDPEAAGVSESPKTPGISIVIVSYNVREYLDACIQSIYHAAETFAGDIEVIVFDNDSRDGTLALLKPRYPEVIWLKSDRNLGFGTGCNRGAALATQDLLLFLNPDTLVSENTFQVMWDFFQTEAQIGVAGCKIVNRDGSLQLACKRSFPSPQVAAFKFVGLSGLFPKSRVFGRYNLTFLDENKTHEVDAVSGSFMCVKTELFRGVGGFDEDFFMYGEDLDICFRIKLLGKRNFYHPQTTAIHFKGESAKSKPFRSFLYFYEAMVIFSRKHFELRALPLFLFYFGVTVLASVNFAYSRFQKWQRWLADLVLVNGILAAVTFAYMGYLGMSLPYHTDRNLYFSWHSLVSVAVLIPMAYIGDYGRFVQKLKTVFATLCVSFLGFFALSFFIREEAYSRVAFAFAALFSIVSLISWRFLSIQGGKFFNKIMGSTKRIAILGNDTRAKKLADLILQERLEGYEFVGFIKLGSGRVSQDIMQNLIGDLSTLSSIVNKVELQGVIIAVEEGAFQMAVKLLSEKSNHELEVKLLVGEPEPGMMSLIDLNFRK